MSTQAPDPLQLNVAALAASADLLSGEWPLQQLPRLLSDASAAPGATVRWSAAAGQRSRAGVESEVWLQLQAEAEVQVQCQRCLEPLPVALKVQRRLRFAESEDEAARLDEDSEDDVLVLAPALNLRELVEDELILVLPYCPRHAQCEPPVAPDADDAAAHPFAALAALRRPDGGGEASG